MTSTPVTVKKSPTQNGGLEPWRALRGEMDRMFDRFARGFSFPIFEPFTSRDLEMAPAVDFGEDDKAYTVSAELPGIEEKDIDVNVSHGVLTLRGEKKHEREEKNKNYYLSERSFGSFERSFTLPDDVDEDKIAAAFSKGVLTVTLPKIAEAQKPQKKIEVKAA